MSRHELPSRAPHLTVFAGWDPPLETYFLQVYDDRLDEEENPCVWIGTEPRKLYDLDHLRRKIPHYADLSPALAQVLYADRDEGR